MRRSLVVIAIAAVVVVFGAAGFLAFRGRHGTIVAGLALTYACPEPVAATDAPIVQARLDDVGAHATAEAPDASHVLVRVASDAASVDLVRSVVTPHVLEIRAVDETAMRALAAGPLPPGVSASPLALPTIDSASEAALAAVRPPSGTLAVGCDGPATCHAWALGPAELGNDDVADASASTDDAMGARIDVTLTDAGRGRLAALTARTVRSRLAVVFDGHVLMAPIVQEPITGGRLSITLGANGDAAYAEAVARALRSGRLACSGYVLERQDVFGPGRR